MENAVAVYQWSHSSPRNCERFMRLKKCEMEETSVATFSYLSSLPPAAPKVCVAMKCVLRQRGILNVEGQSVQEAYCGVRTD